MIQKYLTMTFILFSIASMAKSQTQQESATTQKPTLDNSIYQLFPTKNISTFIKLDSRNGKMWQVLFSISDSLKGELTLNPLSLIKKEKEVIGRFTLYPTYNIYNFLLLDQIEGRVYQVQWSMNPKQRFVIPIE